MSRFVRIAFFASGWLVAALLLFAKAPERPPGPTFEPRAPTAVANLPSPTARKPGSLCQGERPAYHSLKKLAEFSAEERWASRVDSLEGQLAAERERSARYRHDLEARQRLAARPSRPAQPTRRQAPARAVSSTPRVQLIGSDAFVTGRLRNPRGSSAWVTLRLVLLLDHRPQDETTLYLQVPAGSSLPYSHTFSTSLADGTYAARAEVY